VGAQGAAISTRTIVIRAGSISGLPERLDPLQNWRAEKRLRIKTLVHGLGDGGVAPTAGDLTLKRGMSQIGEVSTHGFGNRGTSVSPDGGQRGRSGGDFFFLKRFHCSAT